jgi:diguanylate cyclase (GGDEF)-like protein
MNSHLLNSSPRNLLIVDDIPDNLRILSMALSGRGYEVRCVKSGAMALITVEKEVPDLILLDIKMPDLDGYEVCQRLKANPLTCEIPVIFLSAFDDVIDKVKAFEVGGVDYITKPFQIEEVVVRIQHQLALQAAKAEISQLNLELEQKVKARTLQLEELVTQLNQEIAEHHTTQEKLTQQALHDALTGLPNRVLFMEHLQKAIQRSHRHKHYFCAVLFIDLDRFKSINDLWGHAVGDQLLIEISRILQGSCRDLDTIARLSGDEFTILLEDLEDYQNAIHVAERLLDKLTSPIALSDRHVFSGASIGVVLDISPYQTGSELLRDADIAMYRAKSLGKGRYAIFDQQMYAQTLHVSQLESDLRLAIERNEFVLYYQPITSLLTEQIIGFEALLRWAHPEKGLVGPDEFIAIAEETGLITPIGEWVLREACQQLRVWQDEIPMADSLYISVNLSSQQLKQFDFVNQVVKILQETGLDGQSLYLELTETMLMDQGDQTIELLSQIKVRGIQLSIDDFGTGYSSLSYLHRFPIDALKIDRSFVMPMTPEVENWEIVKTIITLAHSLGITAIAEGVETNYQLTQLKQFGCDGAQGYYFSKPVDRLTAESLLLKAQVPSLPKAV